MQLPPAVLARLVAGPGAAEPLPVERDPAAGAAPFRFAPRLVRFPREHEFFEVREWRKRSYLGAEPTAVRPERGRGLRLWAGPTARRGGVKVGAGPTAAGGRGFGEAGRSPGGRTFSCVPTARVFCRTGTCSVTSISRTCSLGWLGRLRGPGELLCSQCRLSSPHTLPPSHAYLSLVTFHEPSAWTTGQAPIC